MLNKLVLTVCLFLGLNTFAKEGMWIPTLLEAVESDMKSFGCELSAEDIYSVNNSSLKDAIVHFGGGCTAEVISDQGLLLTNHHCGYGQIQSHSSLENDYLKNGFWAKTMADELANPGLTATFIVEMMDVSEELLDLAFSNPEAFEKKKEALIADRLNGEDYLEAVIRPFNYGNSYFMIVSKTFSDVRLVGAPPSAVGKFGGDTDNWVWPRHTGDFSMFRIYADENNLPAEYSENNKAYQAPRHLEVSLNGVKEGDFTMVFGFPGRTEQHLLSSQVSYVVEKANPMRLAMRESSLSIIDQAMRSSDKIRIQYAAKQSSISNAYKKWIGQNKGLIELKAIQQKLDEEEAFKSLAAMKGMEESTLPEEINALAIQNQDYQLARDAFIEWYYYGPELPAFARGFNTIINSRKALEDKGGVQEEIDALKAITKGFFKDYQQGLDEQIFDEITALYVKHIRQDLQPDELKVLAQKFKGDVMAYRESAYKKSLFTSEEGVMKMLADLEAGKVKKWTKKVNADPIFKLGASFVDGYYSKIRPSYNEFNTQIEEKMHAYVKTKMVLFPNNTYWSDANSTLRLTFGKAEGSVPRDGIVYKSFTTADGILEKYIPGDADFDLPADLVDLLSKEEYGIYAAEDGELHVCFTGSNHTTGGNSGSPALNAKGQLIGLNFDRTWESTMSDILFDPVRCRNIMVDIRYILFIVDKYADAQRLIEEMTLVVGEESPEMEEPALEGMMNDAPAPQKN
jgi:peroxiredoxin family protein